MALCFRFAHECSVKLSGLTRYWSWDQLWASPRWLYGDCTSEIADAGCANIPQQGIDRVVLPDDENQRTLCC